MPSIFTSSKSSKRIKADVKANKNLPHTIKQDVILPKPPTAEFGALIAHAHIPSPPASPTVGSHDAHTSAPPTLPPKFSFLSTRTPHKTGSDNSIDSFGYGSDEVTGLRPYGFLGGVGAGVVLGLEDVRTMVKAVAAELESRGPTLPMLFSNQALEASQARTKLLIHAYIDSLSSRGHGSPTTRSRTFTHDLHYAKEYELAWFLRWILSRVTRVSEGTKEALHGLIEWEVYEEWRGRERSAGYPIDAFPYLSGLVPSPVYSVLQPLFHLLSRFTAHSHLSGLTPQALSSLFAPLVFNIPVSLPALTSHTTFVRAASATEHLLLSYIRSSGQNRDLGLGDLPGRLREWVQGYPAMIATDSDLARGQPRRGAKVIRCERATRTVRAYSKDLIVSAEHWVEAIEGKEWPTWQRVLTRKRGDEGRPKFSPAYRKRMNVKETPPLPLSSEHCDPVEYGSSVGMRGEGERAERGRERGRDSEEEAKWGSLAGKEWSMFEEGGFAGGSEFGEKLRFDLTESAKMSISQKRQTMSWTEFASSSGGFNRTDPILSSTLTFSPPISTSIAEWPKERSDLQKRLHKSQKESVPFTYDTTPLFGAEAGWDAEGEVRDGKGRVYVEEAFVDFWADLGMGAGWIARGEMTFKEANWAFVEYKAVPSGDFEAHPREDPRRGELCFLFEERVPYDYQYAIANPIQKRTFNLFSRKKKTAPPPNLQLGASLMSRSTGGMADDGMLSLTNSRSASHGNIGNKGTKGEKKLSVYSPAQAEFDRMLMSPSKTKRVQLGRGAEEATIWHKSVDKQPASASGFAAGAGAGANAGTGTGGEATKGNGNGPNAFKVISRTRTYSGAKGDNGERVGEGRTAFFSRSIKRHKEREGEKDKRKQQQQQQQEVDFELQSASGVESNRTSPGQPLHANHDEDKWMDILIANGARRMDRQDASPPRVRRKAPASDEGEMENMALQVPHDGKGLPASPRPGAAFSVDSSEVQGEYIDPSGESPSKLKSAAMLNNLHSPETSGEMDEDIRTPGGSAFSSPRDDDSRGMHVQPIVVGDGSPSRELQAMHLGTEAVPHSMDAYSTLKPLPSAPNAGLGMGLPHNDQAKPRFVSRGFDFDPYASPASTHEKGKGKVNGPLPIPIPNLNDSPLRRQPASAGNRGSFESGSDRAEILAPSPVPHRSTSRGRDTIVNIVDTYRDSEYTVSSQDDTGRYSRFSRDGSSEAEADGAMYASEEEGAHEEMGMGMDPRYSAFSDTSGDEGVGDERIRFRPMSDVQGDVQGGVMVDGGKEKGDVEDEDGDEDGDEDEDEEEDEFKPPEPLFDIAPTREPSPGRYRHGLPLGFVSEEDEDAASTLRRLSSSSRPSLGGGGGGGGGGEGEGSRYVQAQQQQQQQQMPTRAGGVAEMRAMFEASRKRGTVAS